MALKKWPVRLGNGTAARRHICGGPHSRGKTDILTLTGQGHSQARLRHNFTGAGLVLISQGKAGLRQPRPWHEAQKIALILGCVREWLAFGTVFGVELSRSILPMASMPAGGFIVLGVVCAVWRALARKQREYLKNEARGYLAVHPQSQESGKEEKE